MLVKLLNQLRSWLCARTPGEKILIFSGTFEQARNFATQNNMRPTEWTYLDWPEKLRGLRNVKIVTCGSWWEQKNSHLIEDEIKLSVMFKGCVLESSTLTIPDNKSIRLSD